VTPKILEPDTLKFLFLEPFFGGSHKDFAEGLVAHSKHTIELVTLPARFWKWRMRGAAFYFAKQIPSPDAYDGMITSDLMSLSDFKMLTGGRCPPALVYFHENQITYPLAPGEQRDVQFGFTDITTALSAQRILFNSQTHLDAFFRTLPNFLGMMPEYRPFWVTDTLRKKAGVLYPGCRFPARWHSPMKIDPDGISAPLIVWNHRWEFDKNPTDFFNALDAVTRMGLDFRLALLGENFQTIPKEFIAARERFGDRIVQYGFTESPKVYRHWLKEGAIVVSTANQENFGIAIAEAVRYGCLPLLPNRLAYPEIIPIEFHRNCLYNSQNELVEKLSLLLTHPHNGSAMRKSLSDAMAKFSWEKMITRYDRELEALAGMNEQVSSA